MYTVATAKEKAQHATLKPYEQLEDAAGDAYLLAKKYGKKAEIDQARKAWQEAQAVVIAVENALIDFNIYLEAAKLEAANNE